MLAAPHKGEVDYMRSIFFTFICVSAVLFNFNQNASASEPKPVRPLVALPDYSPLVEVVSPQVVAISVFIDDDPSGTGSGFFISSQCHLATNHHVISVEDKIDKNEPLDPTTLPSWVPRETYKDVEVEEPVVRYEVETSDGQTHSAEVLGSDPRTDLAVMKVDTKDCPAAQWGDAKTLKRGHSVLAVGAPFGLNQTVTAGIISAIGRTSKDIGVGNYNKFIQSDTAVNPGNSGGPLYDVYGRVVGVNTQIVSNGGDFAGISFSIPSNMAKKVSNMLITKGKVSYGWLGISMIEQNQQVTVIGVQPGSPADIGGLKVKDIILNFDNSKIEGSRHLTQLVGNSPAGSKVSLKILRGEENLDLQLVLTERASEEVVAKTFKPEEVTEYSLEDSKIAITAFENIIKIKPNVGEVFNQFLEVNPGSLEMYNDSTSSEEEIVKNKAEVIWTFLMMAPEPMGTVMFSALEKEMDKLKNPEKEGKEQDVSLYGFP